MVKTKSPDSLRIFLVEDHHIMRRGLASLLTAGRNISIVGEAGDGESALEKLSEIEVPDLIIMDVSLPGMNGIHVVREIKKIIPGVKVLMLSMYENPLYIYQAMDAGAAGYILKKALVEELNQAIDAVMAGKQYLSSRISENLNPNSRSYQRLTSREQEVLSCLAGGASVKDIAEEMVISIYTVYTHVNNIKRKIGIKRTADLVRYAVENPLVLDILEDPSD